jgi:hypothetical protein
MADPSIACSLTENQLRERLGELRELSRDALISAQRDGLALRLRYKLEAENRIRRMIEREQECCAFLTFDLRIEANAVALGINAPETARQGIEHIYAQFLNDNTAQSDTENSR